MMHYNTKTLKVNGVNEMYKADTYNQTTALRWYACGAYAADGYNARHGISFEVQAGDEDWARSLNNIITEWFGIDGYWNYKTVNGHCYVRVRHYSVLLSQYFTELYIPARKSLSLQLNPGIPDMYLSAFLLGYSDGNGYISHRHRHVTAHSLEYGMATGSLDFANAVCSVLSKIAVGRVRSRNGYSIDWSNSNNAEAILDYLYSSNIPCCLERKRKKYEGWKNRTIVVPATHTWTDTEKKFVKSNMGTMMQKEMAFILGKTVSSVGAMAWRIKNGTVSI